MTEYIERMPEFDTDQDGLLESPWVEDRRGGRGNHLGLDDSPQYWNYVEIPKDGGTDTRENTNLTDVALNSYYALMAENLAQDGDPARDEAGAERYARCTSASSAHQRAPVERRARPLPQPVPRRELGADDHAHVFYPLFGGLATPERPRSWCATTCRTRTSSAASS